MITTADALRLASLGYHVFPLLHGSKTPLRNSRGHLDASREREIVGTAFDGMYKPNIGIALKPSGLVVVDIDKPQALDEELRGLLEQCKFSVRTPKGYHYYYRRTDDTQARRCVRCAQGIDILGEGYVVGPGSEVGERRYVARSEIIRATELDPLPERLAELMTRHATSCEERSESNGHYEAFDYFSKAVPEGERHKTMTSYAGRMRAQGASYELLLNMLLAINARCCRPPLPEREVESIAESYARKPTRNIFEIAQSLRVFDTTQRNETVSAPRTAELPVRIERLDGLLAEIVDASMACAPKPNFIASFCGALALLSVLYGRRVTDQFGTAANLQLVLLAPSGAGKDHPRQFNKFLLGQIGAPQLVQEQFASGEGIEDYLTDCSASVLFQYDEIHTLIKQIGSATSDNATRCMNTLMTLFSAAQTSYTTRAKASRRGEVRNRTVIRPNVVLFGTSVTQHFITNLSEDALSNGFIARLLLFETGHSDWNERQISMQAALTQHILERCAQAIAGIAQNESSVPPNIVSFSWEERACTMRKALRDKTEREMRARSGEGREDIASVLARRIEQASKLALLFAASRWCCGSEQMVLERDFCLGYDVVSWCHARMLALIDQHAHATRVERHVVRFAQLATAFHAAQGDKPLPYRWLARHRFILGEPEWRSLCATLHSIGALLGEAPTQHGGRAFQCDYAALARIAAGLSNLNLT